MCLKLYSATLISLLCWCPFFSPNWPFSKFLWAPDNGNCFCLCGTSISLSSSTLAVPKVFETFLQDWSVNKELFFYIHGNYFLFLKFRYPLYFYSESLLNVLHIRRTNSHLWRLRACFQYLCYVKWKSQLSVYRTTAWRFAAWPFPWQRIYPW